MSEDVCEIIRSLNWADMRLYEHFFRKFEKRIRDFGIKKMAYEIDQLQQVQQDWEIRCLDQQPDEEDSVTCQLMTEKELQFTDILRERQAELIL